MGIGGNEPSKDIKRIIDYVLCTIEINGKSKGKGFICKIPYPDEFNLLPVLITNKILNESDIQKNNCIKIYLDKGGKERELLYNEERKIFISDKYNTVFLTIIPEEDGINNFLFLNENKNEIRVNNEINIYQYNNNKEIRVYKGEIKKIKDFEFKHNCSIERESLGFPIVSLNNKVIGIIKKNDKDNYNYGTILYKPLEEFKEKLTKKIDEQVKKCLCIIEIGNFTYIGFLCKIFIKDNNYLSVLITKYLSLENLK